MAFSRYQYAWAALLLLLSAVGPFTTLSHAEQKTQLGPWDVHYIAFTSTFLTPDIAKTYGIMRSKFNGVVNISVLDKSTQQAQQAVLVGEASNLLGVVKPLAFKEIKEGDAIYYIAVLPFSDQEQYRINVTINSGTQQATLKFQHKFYAE